MLEEIEYRVLAVIVGEEMRYDLIINHNFEKVRILDKFDHFSFGSMWKFMLKS